MSNPTRVERPRPLRVVNPFGRTFLSLPKPKEGIPWGTWARAVVLQMETRSRLERFLGYPSEGEMAEALARKAGL